MITEFSSEYLLIHETKDKDLVDGYRIEISSIVYEEFDFVLLTEYIDPPLDSVRYDGEITACLLNKNFFANYNIDDSKPVRNVIYQYVYHYLKSDNVYNYKIFQLGKPFQKALIETDFSKCSEVIIPHKGKLSLLSRCLGHLSKTEAANIPTKIIFDSYGYKSFIKDIPQKENLTFYKNAPLAVGPYLGKHYAMLKSTSTYFYLQDSDDISVLGRFEKQFNYLLENGLDMVGCHELRLDQFSRTLKLVRFPLDVNSALSKKAGHPLFHPTSLIKREKYIECGGFSLNRKFSSDTQFLLRAYFTMKIGNVDDFLYIRFNRPNSLTTNHISNLKSEIRKELDALWKKDFQEIKSKELNINDSSLKVEKHEHVYNLIKLDRRR